MENVTAVAARPGPAEIRRLLTDAWSELLDLDVQPEDDFFDLGGYSLLIVDIVGRARRAGIRLEARDIYEHRTIARITDAVLTAREVHAGIPGLSGPSAFAGLWRDGANPWSPEPADTIVRVRPQGAGEPLFVVPWGVGNVDFLPMLGAAFAEGRPLYGIESPGARQEVRPLLSIGEMAEHYIAQILRIQPEGPYHLCGICQGGLVALEMARILQQAGQRVPVLAVANLPDLDPFLDPAWGPGEILDFRMELMRAEYGVENPARDLERALPSLADLGWYRSMDPGDFVRHQAIWSANTFAQLHYSPRPYAGPVLMAQLTAWDAAIRRRWDDMLPARQVVTVEGTQHTIPVLRSPVFLDALNAMLAPGTSGAAA